MRFRIFSAILTLALMGLDLGLGLPFAQGQCLQGTVQGTVVNDETGQCVPATVTLTPAAAIPGNPSLAGSGCPAGSGSPRMTAATCPNGYSFSGVSPGHYTVSATAPGYAPAMQDVPCVPCVMMSPPGVPAATPPVVTANIRLRPLPALCFSPPMVDFGFQQKNTTSSPQTVTLTNCGTPGSTLFILQVRIEGADRSDFHISSDTGESSLTVGQAGRRVIITFTPTAAGPRSATLRIIASNDPNNPIQNVPLSGNGNAGLVSVSPTHLDFGDIPFETRSAPQTITVTNIGMVPVTITGISINDFQNFFIRSGGGPGTLQPGDSRIITVDFAPSGIQSFSDTLSIFDDVFGSPQTVQLTGNGTSPPPPPQASVPANLDFGSVALGTSVTQSVTVTNIGPVTVQIYPIPFIDGPHSADFQDPITDFVNIPVGGHYDIAVTYTPTVLGPETATLHIQTNANPFPFQVLLSGNGVQPAETLLQVGQPVAHSTGLEFFGANPPPPESTNVTALRGVGPDGSLFLVDWAGTALIRVPPGAMPGVTPAEILVDPSGPRGTDQVSLARLLRVEISSSGASALLALRADNRRGIYRFQNGSLSLLGALAGSRGPSRELTIDDSGQIAYLANVDANDPNSAIALYQTVGGAPVERLREGGTVPGIAGATIDTSANPNSRGLPRVPSFSSLTSNGKGDLSVLVRLRLADGTTAFAVLRQLNGGVFVPLAVTGQTLVERGRGTGVTGVLAQLRRPRIGPDGSVVFLGGGSDFVNFYIARPAGPLAALLATPGTDLTILSDTKRLPASSGNRFDYEIGPDGTVALQTALANPADSTLALVSPAGVATPVVTGRQDIEPILSPVFGPQGLVFFLAEDQTRATDRSGRYLHGLYRYRQGGTAPEVVATPGQTSIPGWTTGSVELLGITQRPVITGNDLLFGAIFGGFESQPVPTAALFRVPLNGTLSGDLSFPEGLVTFEGGNETDASRLAILRDLSYRGDEQLVAYALMPGAGPVIAPPPSTATTASRFRTQATQLPPVMPLVAEGDDLGAGRLENVIPPLVSLGRDQELFPARTSFAQAPPRRPDNEGLFTVSPGGIPSLVRIAVTHQPVPGLSNTIFNGFADTPLYLLGPPSVAGDGRVVFKALLDQNRTPLASVFQESPGGQPVPIFQPSNPSDPNEPAGWAAGPSGSLYVLDRPARGVGTLLSGTGPPLQPLVLPGATPATSGGVVTDVTSFVLDGSGRAFVVAQTTGGAGVFRVDASQPNRVQLIPIAIRNMPVSQVPGDQGNGYLFDGDINYLQLEPDSQYGDLVFRATVVQALGQAGTEGEFELTPSGLITHVIAFEDVNSARSLGIDPLGSYPTQTRNGRTVSADFDGNVWSIYRFQKGPQGNTIQELIAREQKGVNGAPSLILDTQALLEQETDLRPISGPVFTVNDNGDVAFLASDGKVWGVRRVAGHP